MAGHTLDMYQKHRLFDLIIILLLAAIVLSSAWIYRDFAQDDAYITYRYARNLARGDGFVYNAGEPILGTSTPLYTLLLAILGKVTGQQIHEISHIVGVISLWAAGATLYYLGKDRGRWTAAAIALVFSSSAFLMTSVGMETLFLLALMMLSLRSYLDGKVALAGILLGMLVLTRYECILFAGLLGVHFWLWRKKAPTWLLATVLVCLPWLIYAWSTFGNAIPHSALTKLADSAAGHGYPFTTGALMWWRVYALDSPGYWLLVPLVLLGLYAALRYKRENQAYMLILMWSALYFLGASITAGSFSWYYGPLIPGFSILLVWGAEFLAYPLGSMINRGLRPNLDGGNLRVAFLGLMVLGIVILQVSSWEIDWVSNGDQVIDSRFPKYLEVAQWLNLHANEDESLAVEEIGILGYYTELSIVDLLGLVTHYVEPGLEQNHSDTLSRAIERYQPEYVLTSRLDWVDLLEQSDLYQPAREFSSGSLVLFTMK